MCNLLKRIIENRNKMGCLGNQKFKKLKPVTDSKQTIISNTCYIYDI